MILKTYKGWTLQKINQLGKHVRNGQRILTEEEAREIKKIRGRLDPEFFFAEYLSHWQRNEKTLEPIPTSQFHRDFMRLMMGDENVLGIMPRGHAKTTRAKMLLIWMVAYNVVDHILVWSSDKMVRAIIWSIRQEFEENEKLKRDFHIGLQEERDANTGKIKKKRWTQKMLEFSDGTTIEGVSKFGSVRGSRPDVILCDDVQENKDVENPEMAEKFYNHFRTSLVPTLKPTGKIIVLGTNVGANCLVQKIYDDQDNTFDKFKFEAIEGLEIKREEVRDKNNAIIGHTSKIVAGKPIWGERYSLERFNKFLKDMGYDAFMQEFQNTAFVLNKAPVFDRDFIFRVKKPTYVTDSGWKYYGELDADGKPIPQSGLIFGFDLSEGGALGDYSTCVGINRKGGIVWEFEGKLDQTLFASQFYMEIWQRGFRGKLMPEKNTGLAFIEALKGYPQLKPNIYTMKRVEGRGRSEFTMVYGWSTNAATKRKMIEDYKFYLRYTSEELKGYELPLAKDQKAYYIDVTERIQEQIRTYYVDEKGSCNATAGNHDDVLIAHMIACQELGGLYVPDFIDPNQRIEV